MRGGALYRVLLYAYPAEFRQEYGREMTEIFALQMGEARGNAGRVARLWLAAIKDLGTVAPREHMHMVARDIRYALRMLAGSRGFTAVAILSLGLGIGATTAIFSLWRSIADQALPVAEPERLVMLTNPNHRGVSIGMQGGERGLLTYAEFESLRDESGVFSGLMAAQSSLERYDARVSGRGGVEEVRARLVSGSYFQVLGVTPLLGRVFSPADDRAAGAAPYAVLSYDYWQRRFGGREEAIGATVTIHKAVLTIVGVMPRSFFGETVGERPDLWAPLQMQAGVLPGRDWLHDTTADKVMWLHAFGRLQPGVTMAQAQAKVNVVFQNGLRRLYGAVLSTEASRGFLDQRLVIRPAATGASAIRSRFADPLQILLAAVAMLLLIACANVANLLMARGAARQREMALRLTLGAGRGRLIRQLLTESAVLAAAGGLAGMAIAYVLHRALVFLVSGAVDAFTTPFALDTRMLMFGFAVTAAASMVFGLLPAWLAARVEPGASLHGRGRGATGSAGQMRFGRLLVAAQLALSLPLIVGAGLLARTLHNLQIADLGYSRDGLITARLDAQTGSYAEDRRAAVYLAALDEIRRVPGVRAASFSENGLFTGRNSGDEIEVEGYTRKGDNDRGSSWDQGGPELFTTLGIPILLGRDFNERDNASAPKVCIINEAFAAQFFAGRNPLGMRITAIYGDSRRVHHVVGVARDARVTSLRRAVGPKYWVPVTQPLASFGDVTFAMRVTGDRGTAIAGVRRAVERVDANLPLSDVRTLEERLERSTGQDRLMAWLAGAFAAAALILAAIGLYGVLSYGVARRRSEIGIRMALGAQTGQVTRMILRETAVVTAMGLAAGAGLAYAATRLVKSQLYGIAPEDPLTLAAAFGLLGAVALGAGYLPARRAAGLDPVTALRQD
ncbi:MAG: ABC transporter permease [Bryobacteraceae bacterium]